MYAGALLPVYNYNIEVPTGKTQLISWSVDLSLKPILSFLMRCLFSDKQKYSPIDAGAQADLPGNAIRRSHVQFVGKAGIPHPPGYSLGRIR